MGRRNTGVVTDRVRAAVGELGKAHPEKVILADSRERIGEFHHVIHKGNRDEVRRAAMARKFNGERVDGSSAGNAAEDRTETADLAVVERWGRSLFENGTVAGENQARPVYVTLGADGLLLIDTEACLHIPGIRVPEPLDAVGAGDSVTAGIVASLGAGATPAEAGLVGNLAASVTVRQMGVTGTASPAQLLEALKELS